jgi:peptide/histidine transporter 3/4
MAFFYFSYEVISKTWQWRVLTEFQGLACLAVQAAVPGLLPAAAEGDMNTRQAVFLYSGLYLVAFGSGMVKPCVSTFGGDQFREEIAEEKALISRFFSWFYISINIGSFVSKQ